MVQSKRLMMAAADRRYLLVDHSKFGRPALHFVTDLAAFDYGPDRSRAERGAPTALEAAGVQLRIVEGEGGE